LVDPKDEAIWRGLLPSGSEVEEAESLLDVMQILLLDVLYMASPAYFRQVRHINRLI
jgi:hypothetical protein